MRTQIPARRLALLVVSAVLAFVLFAYLTSSFGGPDLSPSNRDRYRLKATFADSQNLVKKSLVMSNGFQIGEVKDVEIVRGVVHVEFTIFEEFGPVHAGTIAQIGHRTIFGEPIVKIFPGPRRGAELEGGSRVRTIDTVEPDEALQVFDADVRRLLARGTRELARGFRAPDAGRRVNATIGALNETLKRLRAFTDTLRGDEEEIASLVRSSATVLDAVDTREQQLRHVIGSGRTVMAAIAGQERAFGRGLDEMHALLGVANRALPRARPLLRRSLPVLQRAAVTARRLLPALVALEPVLTEARRAIDAGELSSRRAAPMLRAALKAEESLLPFSVAARPAVANLVPTLEYVADLRDGWASMIANGSQAFGHRGSTGYWLHGFLTSTAGGLVGQGYRDCPNGMGLCTNPYPKKRDALSPQPYEKGSYPRLMPYRPPR